MRVCPSRLNHVAPRRNDIVPVTVMGFPDNGLVDLGGLPFRGMHQRKKGGKKVIAYMCSNNVPLLAFRVEWELGKQRSVGYAHSHIH